MCVATKAVEEVPELLVNHRVIGDGRVELGFLLGARKLAMEQQIAGFEEICLFGKLLDWIAAMEQNACTSIDVGNG